MYSSHKRGETKRKKDKNRKTERIDKFGTLFGI